MQEDDHLFVRCLTIVLLVSGGILSALLLAPPPMDWDGVAASQQPLAPDGKRTYDVRVIFVSSRGRNAAPSPIQTGESAWQRIAERLAPPPPPLVTRPAPPRPRAEPSPVVVAGPLTEMSLESRNARSSPPAIQDERRVVGGDASIAGTRPPPRPEVHVEEPAPQRLEIAPENIMAVRPVFPHSRLTVTQHTDERQQDTADDPLPEFRRLMPRFNACARDVSRRNREPIVGKVILRFTVDERGHVRDARPVGGSLRDPDARDCIVNVLLSSPVFEERRESVTADRAVIFAG